ncbi:MAG: hypothetical protein MMC33_006749 [Icmadophila ericetorum]|nr:hypothetical protein [Icmadophila ericetorum]
MGASAKPKKSGNSPSQSDNASSSILPNREKHTAPAIVEDLAKEKLNRSQVFGPITPWQFLNPFCENCSSLRSTSKPNGEAEPIYVCSSCPDNRPLCIPCARSLMFRTNNTDPHEACHYLQEWKSESFLDFSRFFVQNQRDNIAIDADGIVLLAPMLLNSEHAFIPSEKMSSHTTRSSIALLLESPPGNYSVRIDFRTKHHPDALLSSRLSGTFANKIYGGLKSMGVQTGLASLGTITFDVQSVQPSTYLTSLPRFDSTQDPPHSLGQSVATHAIMKGTAHEHEFGKSETIHFERPVLVEDNQLLRIEIAYEFDNKFFRGGSPFSWWFDSIR